MSPRGLFVTGTDTGVGKTRVACAIVRAWREAGLDVGVMKPAETGVGPDGPLDARALRAAAAVDDALDLICPEQYALPAAPLVSARAEGRAIDLARVERAYATLARRHEVMIVEGAGGLLVPLTSGQTMADLAARLALPVLVVARAALGTVNHTLLTLEALRARGLPLAGVVINHCNGPISDADASNLRALADELGDDLVGVIPPLADHERPQADALRLEVLRDRAAGWPAAR